MSEHIDTLQMLLDDAKRLLNEGDNDSIRLRMAQISTTADKAWNESMEERG